MRAPTTALALRQAATTVDTARANLAAYTRQAAQDRNTLMLLIGARCPRICVRADLDAQRMSADLPVGVPSEVLARRPDVLAAEHQLIAANAQIGAARAAFFPSITLTGSYGTASTQLSGLFKPGSSAWTFSPQISVPIFAGGANVANLDLAKVEKNVYIAQYEKALQSAFREVDDALAARATLDEQLAAQRALLEDASESYKPGRHELSQWGGQLSAGAGCAALAVLCPAGGRQPGAAAAPEYGNSIQGFRRRNEGRYRAR
jgi:multidrug efflux system outer membrane protein